MSCQRPWTARTAGVKQLVHTPCIADHFLVELAPCRDYQLQPSGTSMGPPYSGIGGFSSTNA